MGRVLSKKGFTIVELLIVIGVIAILAAITIVSYRGITESTKTTVLEVSLKKAADEVKLSLLNSSQLTALPSSVKPENDTILQLAKVSESREFCINGYRASPYQVSSYDSQSGQIRPYLCTGVLLGSPVGGSLPAVPLNTNLIAPDFKDWELTGSVTYDESTKELTFSGTTGKAVSPLVRLAGSATNTAFTYELYSTTGSVTYSPQAGGYSGSAYYATDGVTSVLNSGGYATNGNAQAVPLSAWTARTFSIGAGPNVQYVRFNLNLSPANYTSNNFKVRNPSIERR